MNATASEILADLNPPQREAVETLSGPLLILAGAGSGKTRVVTRRIANLIAHGTRPWEVLAITFTNKAAGEMRRRVEDLVGASGAWVSTFHSFCARILRREAAVLGFSPEYSIYDEDDAVGVLDEIATRLHLEEKRHSARNLRAAISDLKSKALGPGDLDGSTYDERILQQVYREYAAALAKNQALDFDDLLLHAVRLFRDHPDVLARYRARFRHLLVDEYQDTNACQYQLVKLLGQGHGNVCVTGDPDQSIYSWRGADIKNILSFEQDFPLAKVVRLEQNYRSTPEILAVASAVIRHNAERKEKELWTEKPPGEKAVLRVVGDGELEAYEVAAEITRLAREGRGYGEAAIFYRTNAQSRPFEAALIQAAIPYQLIGGTPFYERREVKDALAYLRLIVNPKDDVSFRRVVNVPRRGAGASTVDLIAAHASRLQCSLLEALDRPEWMEKELKPKPRQELYRFARLLDALRKMPPYPVEPLVARVLEDAGLKAAVEAEPERVENLEQLRNAAAVFDRDHAPAAAVPDGPPPEPGAYDGLEELAQERASLGGFLENAALVQATDAPKEAGGAPVRDDAERVTLMTLHMAKGLEFPFVFLAGAEEGILPLVRGAWSGAQEDPSAIEEERRLFYVGVTRARERLWLLHAKQRMRYGKTDISVPSRFLEEIPGKLVAREDKSRDWGGAEDFGARRRGDDAAFAEFENRLDEVADPGAAEESQLEEAPFAVGDRVRHGTFGVGIVEDLVGSGLSRKARVHFRKVGTKLLLLSLANLRRV